MRYTLLEAVQLILSAMDSDEVNSISDTVESNQVALLLKSVYYDCAVELNLQEQESVFELIASGNSVLPVLMTLPTNVMNLYSIRYNNKLSTETLPNYKTVTFVPFEDFLVMQQSLPSTGTNVGTMFYTINGEHFESVYLNDKFPEYYTTLGGTTLLFDSYVATEDDTLQKSKTLCTGLVYPEFTLSDTFVPQFNPDQFSYYINRAKIRAFAELKQVPNQEASSEARNQKIVIQKRKRRTPELREFERIPKYGRSGSAYYSIPKNLKQGS